MKQTVTVAPGVEYLHAGTFRQPGNIFRINETFEPRLRYSPVALARMFEAAPAMLAALTDLTVSASALRESVLSGHPVMRDNATFITRKLEAARAAIALAERRA